MVKYKDSIRIQDSIYSYIYLKTMRNVYVNSKENIRKPLLLYKVLTDYICGKYII